MELTTENVYQILNKSEYTNDYLSENKFNLGDFTDIIKLLLDSLWPGYRIKYMENKQIHQGPVVESYYDNKLFTNVTQICINDLYPHIIYKLNKTTNNENDPYNEECWGHPLFDDKIIWNIEQFPILFNFLYDNKNAISKDDIRINRLIKILLNFTYGSVDNKYSFIKCQNDISKTIVDVMKHIINSFTDHIIFVDTNKIYFSAFDEIKDEFHKIIKDLGFEYDIINWEYFYPIAKKKYIIGSELIISGIKPISNLRLMKEKEKEKSLRSESDKLARLSEIYGIQSLKSKKPKKIKKINHPWDEH